MIQLGQKSANVKNLKPDT